MMLMREFGVMLREFAIIIWRVFLLDLVFFEIYDVGSFFLGHVGLILRHENDCVMTNASFVERNF